MLIAIYGLIVAFIISLNLTKPQTRKRNVVAALRSNGEGIIMLTVAKFIFWICATVTYLHHPESRCEKMDSSGGTLIVIDYKILSSSRIMVNLNCLPILNSSSESSAMAPLP